MPQDMSSAAALEPVDRSDALSLRTIAVLGVAAVSFLVCLLVSAILLINAGWSVEEEIDSAFGAAAAMIQDRSDRWTEASDTMGAAVELAREVDALRHVAAYVADPVGVVLTEGSGRTQAPREAPGWFVALVGQERKVVSFPITRYPNMLGSLQLVSDPVDEIDEVWEDFRIILPTIAGAGLIALGCALALGLTILRRIEAFGAILARMRSGDLEARAPRQNLSEFARLAEGVNALAAHLAAERTENQRLQHRLMTLTEQERHQLASDLHDGVGPHLFALRAALRDARVLAHDAPPMLGKQLDEALAALSRHAEAVQAIIRSAIENLRPMIAGEATLAELLEDMAAGFADIAPAARITVDADGAARAGDLADLCIYRFAQESVLNALRHGGAERVRITLRREAGPEGSQLRAAVIDDGRGPSREAAVPSYGHLGIIDRARALNARFVPPHRRGAETMTELIMPCA